MTTMKKSVVAVITSGQNVLLYALVVVYIYTRDSDESCSITHDNWILHKHAVRVTFVHCHHMDLRNQLPQYLLVVVVHTLAYSL